MSNNKCSNKIKDKIEGLNLISVLAKQRPGVGTGRWFVSHKYLVRAGDGDPCSTDDPQRSDC